MKVSLRRQGFLIAVILVLASVTHGKNLLPNGSFEVGIGQWIGFDSGMRGGKKDPKKYGEMTLVKQGLISDTEAKIGQHSFCFNYPGLFRSQDVKLDPTKKYTISLYAKGEHGQGEINCSLASSYRPGSGHGDRLYSDSLIVNAGTEWKRHYLTVALPESRNGYYKVWFYQREGDIVWLDGVQIEEGQRLTDYEPAARAEVGITSGHEDQSNLFYTSETVPVRTNVCVYEAAVKEATINYVLWDYRDFKVKEFERTVRLDGNGYGRDEFELEPEWQGLMSLIATVKVDGKELGGEEPTFGYVRPPQPASEADDQNSPVGTHVSEMRNILVAEKLGIRWQRYHFYECRRSVNKNFT